VQVAGEVQACSEAECEHSAAFRTRTNPAWCDEHITAILRAGGLEPLEPFEQRPDVLVFTTDPLTDDTEVTGRISVTLFASTDGPSTDWVARLCDVDDRGVSRCLADGILRVGTVVNEVGEYQIDLWSTSNVFLSGHRIRVQITSSNFPRWDRNLNSGEDPRTATTMRVAHQTVYHDATRPSRITLPIVPPSD
jgi:putative CocE/NonD family hydrolase